MKPGNQWFVYITGVIFTKRRDIVRYQNSSDLEFQFYFNKPSMRNETVKTGVVEVVKTALL